MTAATILWSVPELDSSRQEETGVGAESSHLSQTDLFERMQDLVSSETALRKNVAVLQSTNKALIKQIEDLYKTANSLMSILGDASGITLSS